MNCLNLLAPLILLHGGEYPTAFTTAQLEPLALMFLRLRGHGINLVSIFWGLWLIPFGTLVIRSRYLPPVLGTLLLLAGGAYVLGSATFILRPELMRALSPFTLPIAAVAELAIILWLLLKGADPSRSVAGERIPSAHP